MALIRLIKKSIIEVIPFAMSGNYSSGNYYYNKYVTIYYPDNGIISIGNLNTDRKQYSADISNVFNSYKRAARKEIDNIKPAIN